MSSTEDNDTGVQDGPSQEVVAQQEAPSPQIESPVAEKADNGGDSEGSPRVLLNGDSTTDSDEVDTPPLAPSNGKPTGSLRRKKYNRRTKSRSSLANILAMANADANSVPSISPPISPTSSASPSRVQPSPRKPNPSPRSPRVTPPQVDAPISHLDLSAPSTTTATTTTATTDNPDDGPRPEGRGRSNAFYGRPQPPTPMFLNNNNTESNRKSPSYSDIVSGAASSRPRAGTPSPTASSSASPPTEAPLPQHTYSGICRPSKNNWTKKGDPKYECVKNNSRRFLIGFAETIGRRPTMEDCMVIDGTFRGSNEEDYFAVFDGHGGRDSARFAADHLHTILADKLKSGNPVKSLKEAFAETNNLIKEQKIAGGTTACVVLFIGKKGYVANVGDTRAVLCRDGITHRVSLDHKPELPAETSRIKNLGGHVTTTTNAAGHSTSRVNGMLAVSRALGDTVLQPYVSAEPEIHGPLNITTTTDDNNQFMVMACDGVWDVITDEEAASIVAPIPDVEAACRRLRDEAFQRGSTDNISVMVIRFPQPKPR